MRRLIESVGGRARGDSFNRGFKLEFKLFDAILLLAISLLENIDFRLASVEFFRLRFDELAVFREFFFGFLGYASNNRSNSILGTRIVLFIRVAAAAAAGVKRGIRDFLL